MVGADARDHGSQAELPPLDRERRICRSLALSGVQGICAHCAGAAILFALNWSTAVQFRRVAIPGSAIILLALMRELFLRRLGVWESRRWLRMYSVVLTLTSLCWGSVLAVLLLTEGQNGSTSIPVMLILTGIAAGAQAGIACSRGLHTVYQLSLWLPPLLASYLLTQGAHFHREYLRGIQRETELDDARRAAEVTSRAKSSIVANISLRSARP